MAQLPASSTATILLGGGILLVGYLVKYRGWDGLISANTALQSAQTLPVYASLVGNVTLVAGAFVVGLGVLQAFGVADSLPSWGVGLAFLGAAVLLAPRLSVEVE